MLNSFISLKENHLKSFKGDLNLALHYACFNAYSKSFNEYIFAYNMFSISTHDLNFIIRGLLDEFIYD